MLAYGPADPVCFPEILTDGYFDPKVLCNLHLKESNVVACGMTLGGSDHQAARRTTVAD